MDGQHFFCRPSTKTASNVDGQLFFCRPSTKTASNVDGQHFFCRPSTNTACFVDGPLSLMCAPFVGRVPVIPPVPVISSEVEKSRQSRQDFGRTKRTDFEKQQDYIFDNIVINFIIPIFVAHESDLHINIA